MSATTCVFGAFRSASSCATPRSAKTFPFSAAIIALVDILCGKGFLGAQAGGISPVLDQFRVAGYTAVGPRCCR
eukprot:COSAG05_NODE_355_length_10856_cov_7.197174_6_plen_74_part_00